MEYRTITSASAESLEDMVKADETNSAKNKPKRFPLYYYAYRKISPYYLFVQDSVRITRLPEYVLGQGVLGVAFPHSNYVLILDSLHGTDFEEVLRHEMNHIMFPCLTEYETRIRTRAELPFPANYH